MNDYDYKNDHSNQNNVTMIR